MSPNEHFPGKLDQTKNLCLFRKSKSICFPHCLNVCCLDAKPSTLNSGPQGRFQLSGLGSTTKVQEPSVLISHDSSTLGSGNQLRDILNVIKNEKSDIPIKEVLLPSGQPLGPWRCMYSRNSMTFTSYSWFKSTRSRLCYCPRSEGSSDGCPACSHSMLHLIITDDDRWLPREQFP